MPSRRPPRWTDEDAVVKFVEEKLEEAELEEERLSNTHYRLQFEEGYKEGWIKPFPMPSFSNRPLTEANQIKAAEQWAVDDAMGGGVRRLAELIAPVTNADATPTINPAIQHLSPATFALIVEFLTGKRKLETGRMSRAGGGGPGRPPMTPEERRAANPIHDAAEEFPHVKAILKQHWPEQNSERIEHRTETILQKRYEITASVRNLKRRPRRGRHRV
jgi:hypothetical protein